MAKIHFFIELGNKTEDYIAMQGEAERVKKNVFVNPYGQSQSEARTLSYAVAGKRLSKTNVLMQPADVPTPISTLSITFCSMAFCDVRIFL